MFVIKFCTNGADAIYSSMSFAIGKGDIVNRSVEYGLERCEE